MFNIHLSAQTWGNSNLEATEVQDGSEACENTGLNLQLATEPTGERGQY